MNARHISALRGKEQAQAILAAVTAAVGGFAFFEEKRGLLNVAGMTLVIVSIILMNLTIRIGYKKKYGKYIPPAQRSGDHSYP